MTLPYRSAFKVIQRRVTDYGTVTAVRERFDRKNLTQEFLFPAERDDPFKAHLAKTGVDTFL